MTQGGSNDENAEIELEEHHSRHLSAGDNDGGNGADERGLGGDDMRDTGSIPYLGGDDMRDIGSIPYLEGWMDGVLALNGNDPTKIQRPAEEQLDYLKGFKAAVQFMQEGGY